MRLKRIATYALWIAVFEAVSFACASMTNENIDAWYATLTAPPLVPPNVVFPIVWSILYAMIACAGCYLWLNRQKDLLILFGLYMLLNWSWSFIYFGAHAMGAALIEIVVMDILLLILIKRAWNVARPAALLLLPLLVWSLFATYLNAGYWVLN